MCSAADEATAVLSKKMNSGEGSVSLDPIHVSSQAVPVSAAPIVVAEEKTQSVQAAWEMVQQLNVAKKPEELRTFLEDMGVDNLATFSFLVQNAELLEQLTGLLKPMKKMELETLLKSSS